MTDVDVGSADLDGTDQTLNSEMIGPKLLLSLQYREADQALTVTVHRAANLTSGESSIPALSRL